MSMPSTSAAVSSPADTQTRSRRAVIALLTRLHFYIGIFVGPFLLVAALSGSLYALSPQIESRLYAHQLFTDSVGAAQPLALQIEAAQAVVGDLDMLAAVRPAPEQGMTTRVMFAEPGLRPSETRAIFVDPVTREVRGDLIVYGTSGALPLRGWLDHFHRGLQLDDVGRLYSELAASWLWIAALGGLTLWIVRARAQRHARAVTPPSGLRRWHARLGLWALLGLLFFSATGLTWSQYAGSNIGVLRAQFGWSTPSVATDLKASAPNAMGGMGEHAEHMMSTTPSAAVNPATFDTVLDAARAAGINAGMVEVRPAAADDKAWTVTEIDRRWPTQVDSVAIDPRSGAVVDRADFKDYPLAAKLTRWGIDAHMGTLFGLANQLILVAAASALIVMVVWGYLMWWRRRPSLTALYGPWRTLRQLSPQAQAVTLAIAAVLGYCLPVLGVSLLLFLMLDGLLTLIVRRQGA